MLGGAYQSVALFLVIAVYYVADFLFILYFDRRRNIDSDRSGRNWGYTMFTLFVGAFAILQPWLLPGLSLRIDGPVGLSIQLVGLSAVIVSLGLQWWSRLHLKQYYSERVQILEGHELIDLGPYHYVRHPIFTSFFLLAGGMVLINPSLLTFAILAYAYLDFSSAAKKEEVLMSENVPGYRAYMLRTSRFFPSFRRSVSSG